ncbi:MAG: hypothetical protein U0263_15225 [Polyangiaceae bacterium]
MAHYWPRTHPLRGAPRTGSAEIMKLAVEQFRVMETLTPQDFLAFRDKLIGQRLQSFQLGELEILLGMNEKDRITYAGADPLERIGPSPQARPRVRLGTHRRRGAGARSERHARVAVSNARPGLEPHGRAKFARGPRLRQQLFRGHAAGERG